MTNAELIAKIKAEIERRKNYISVTHFAEELLSFLSTLESEHLADARKTSPKDLEEAKHAFSEERFPDEKMAPLRRAARIGYEAGAKWQAEKDARDMYMSDNRHFNKVYELGKNDMKEQMMIIITKDDNLEEAGAQYVKTHFRDIDWTPDVIKSCLEEAFISGGEYVFKKIKYE